MYSTIMNYICCPKCRRNLVLRSEVEIRDDVIEGFLACDNGHVFRISQGVADFNSEEQNFANQWQAISEEQRFEELDREMEEKNPDEIAQRRKMVLSAIVGAVSDSNCNAVLDVASGRGLLLTELAEKMDEDVHIISIDLSAFVLKYDYQKFKRIAPNKKISYLACDATNLPLKDNAVDAAVTYGGFSNMVGCAAEALREVYRVIKNEGILADSYVVIEKESKGYELLARVCADQHITGAEDFFLHDGLVKHHEKLFSGTKCNVVFEGMGVGNDMDLLPYDGEWYAEQVFISKKS